MVARRTVRGAALALVVTTIGLATAGPALSGTFQTRGKWKNCETTQAGIQITATFADVAAIHGPGRYMVTKEIRWDRLIGTGRWRASDVHSTQTTWISIGNPQYDVVTTIGDRTTWGASYRRNWRAHVTFTLIRNRPGPRDKRVDIVDIYPAKGSFRDVVDCGVVPASPGRPAPSSPTYA